MEDRRRRMLDGMKRRAPGYPGRFKPLRYNSTNPIGREFRVQT
jgi:hypothetical protein